MKRNDDGKLTFSWLSGILVFIILGILGWFGSNTFASYQDTKSRVITHDVEIVELQKSTDEIKQNIKDINNNMTDISQRVIYMSNSLGYKNAKK